MADVTRGLNSLSNVNIEIPVTSITRPVGNRPSSCLLYLFATPQLLNLKLDLIDSRCSWDVWLSFVCLVSVPPVGDRNREGWRVLVKERIGKIAILRTLFF